MADRINGVSGIGESGRLNSAPSLEERSYVADPHSIYNSFGQKSLNPNGAGENEDLFADFDIATADMNNFQLRVVRDFINFIAGSVAGISTPSDRTITAENLKKVSNLVDQRLGYNLSVRGDQSLYLNHTPTTQSLQQTHNIKPKTKDEPQIPTLFA
jgi:hypothetical protein